MTHERLQQLAAKWEDKTISETEMQEFLDWCSSFPELEVMVAPGVAKSKEELENKLFAAISREIKKEPSLKRFSWLKYAAAILLLIIAGTVFYIFNRPDAHTIVESKPVLINPVTDKAILTLSDGRKIDLSDKFNQQLNDGTVEIQKINGVLTYQNALTSDNSVKGYNHLVTPRGGQYQIILPDGSKVWLNAASSLKYPVVFDQKQRLVELVGEAYFEIKQNKSAPFIVKTKDIDVNVLGTEFNVNAYDEEGYIAATLVEGSIKIIADKESSILKPGEQAMLANNSSGLKIDNPDLEKVLAWKEGKLKFEGVNIQTIMRQIARWYDVDIEYRGKITNVGFNGSILKTQSPITLLEVLELTNEIHFEVSGKKIIVIAGPKSR